MNATIGRQVRYHSAVGQETATIAGIEADGQTVNLSVLSHDARQRREMAVGFRKTNEGRWWDWPPAPAAPAPQKPRGLVDRVLGRDVAAPDATQPQGSETGPGAE